MAYLAWSNDYSVHYRAIDNDHKELFDCVNRLHSAIEAGEIAEHVDFAIAMLARYVRDHFEREERLMASYGYPRLAAHKAEHQTFRRVIQAIRRVHRQEPFHLDSAKMLTFLGEWLRQHILGSDMAYAHFMQDGSAEVMSEGEAPQSFHKARKPAKTVKMELEVPSNHKTTLRHLADVLQRGGPDADSLIAFAETVGEIPYEEARAIAAPLLKPD